MRTGPFSSPEVIEKLNASFVPVYGVNEDYRENGSAPKEEKAEKPGKKSAPWWKKLFAPGRAG